MAQVQPYNHGFGRLTVRKARNTVELSITNVIALFALLLPRGRGMQTLKLT